MPQAPSADLTCNSRHAVDYSSAAGALDEEADEGFADQHDGPKYCSRDGNLIELSQCCQCLTQELVWWCAVKNSDSLRPEIERRIGKANIDDVNKLIKVSKVCAAIVSRHCAPALIPPSRSMLKTCWHLQ